MSGKITIGSVAQSAGVNVETIRYYQRRGLVGTPPKRASGFRYYSLETADRIRFIKRAQEFGMSLGEIQRLLKLNNRACSEARAIAATKRHYVEGQLKELTALRDCLKGLLQACDQPHGQDCPIIEQLKGTMPKCCSLPKSTLARVQRDPDLLGDETKSQKFGTRRRSVEKRSRS